MKIILGPANAPLPACTYDVDGHIVVIGNDIAAVRMQAHIWGGTAWTFDELFLSGQRDATKVIARSEMKRLISSQRAAHVYLCKRMYVDTASVPKADALLDKWLRGYAAFAQDSRLLSRAPTGAERILSGLYDQISARGLIPADDLVKRVAEAEMPFPPEAWTRVIGEQYTLIIVQPEDFTDAELTVANAYVEHATNVYITVSRISALQQVIVNLDPENCDLEILKAEPLIASCAQERPQGWTAGHAWEPDTLDKQLHCILGLIDLPEMEDANLSNMVVICDGPVLAHRCLLEMIRCKMPVNCSWSQMLHCRPAVRDVVALLEVLSGVAAVAGMTRVIRLIRRIGDRRIWTLTELMEYELDDESIEDFTSWTPARRDLMLLKSVQDLSADDDASDAIMRIAEQVYSCLPAATAHHDDLKECLPALLWWASEIGCVKDFIREFRRLTIVCDRWTGYKAGSGIRFSTSENYSYVAGDWILHIHPHDDPPLAEELIELKVPLLRVPVVEDFPGSEEQGMRVVVRCDGSAGGEPPMASYGYVIRHSNGTVLRTGTGNLPSATTNNQAEWIALLEGLTAALAVGATEIEIQMDSELIVRQFTGRNAVRRPELKKLYRQAMRIASQSKARIAVIWIPRKENQAAHEMAELTRRPI